MSRHMIVASVDALVFEDIEYAKTLPNFAKILSTGSIIERGSFLARLPFRQKRQITL